MNVCWHAEIWSVRENNVVETMFLSWVVVLSSEEHLHAFPELVRYAVTSTVQQMQLPKMA